MVTGFGVALGLDSGLNSELGSFWSMFMAKEGVVVGSNPDANLFNFFGFMIIINAVSFIILTLNYII
jgi:hypothetical protein